MTCGGSNTGLPLSDLALITCTKTDPLGAADVIVAVEPIAIVEEAAILISMAALLCAKPRVAEAATAKRDDFEKNIFEGMKVFWGLCTKG